MIHYRKADWSDVEPLIGLIEKGFSQKKDSVNYQEGKEHRVLFSYLYAQENWKPEWVYLAEENHNLISAVGVFPQELLFEGHYLPVWSVSPVVTDPQYRSRGAATGCLTAMFDDLKAKNIHAVFLWGIPSYYPRFGFVPILPRYKTKIAASQLNNALRVDAGRIRNVYPNEAEKLHELYIHNESAGWLQPRRNVHWWEKRLTEFDIDNAILKEVPFPKKDNFKIWENSSGKVSGYLNLGPVSEKKEVYVTEGAAVDLGTARAMVAGVLAEIPPESTLIIRGTPDHYLNSAAYIDGGNHINPAPLAGMIKVLDWRKFLQDLNSVLAERIAQSGDDSGFQLEFAKDRDRVVLNAAPTGLEIQLSDEKFELEYNKRLTRLVMGIYSDDDLQYLSGNGKEKYLPRLFPRKYPFIWDANYLF